ncbi:hypothetical protein OS175_05315 [Marinicella sp. S1101]|uniref:hypothetical protein n=1 Tax=Marinicella marina TaxID=2996016 RepID=UPI002260AD37|nr:hypothetical protein [Marinicella marina]MCX7553288.1 hypothetical protein [Marinicella marina]MDJ1139020.1 hypothetical protein [Marinicella marina]
MNLEQMYEVLLTYIYFMFPYPTGYFFYATEMGFIEYAIAWMLVGLSIAYGLHRWAPRLFFKLWIVVWFMPGTLICGSATLIPWITSLFWLGNESYCVTLLSTITCLALNLLVVFTLASVFRKLRQPTSDIKDA